MMPPCLDGWTTRKLVMLDLRRLVREGHGWQEAAEGSKIVDAGCRKFKGRMPIAAC